MCVPVAGVCIGMAIIDMDYTAENIHVLRTQGYAKLTPFFLPKIILNMPAGHVSIKFGLKVPSLSSSRLFCQSLIEQ